MEIDKPIIIVVVGSPNIETTIARLSIEHPTALFCHRGNLDTFDESTRVDLLRVIELEEKKTLLEMKIEPYMIPQNIDFLIPEFHCEKKGKHTPKSKNKYLWKR